MGILPKGATVGIIMTGGHGELKYYSTLRERAGAERCVLLSYSSGMRDKRLFSDGTSMAGKIYIPQGDLGILRENPDAPLLLMDNSVTSGMTLSVLGNSIKKQLDYKGVIYQEERGGIEEWKGKVKGDCPICSTALHLRRKNVPIITEFGPLFGERELSATELRLRWYQQRMWM